MELALIDIEAGIEDQAAAMARSCESVGFFRIPRSAVDRRVADDAWDAAAEFFALPIDEKRAVEFPEPGYPYGYSPFAFETLARSLDDGTPGGPDLKESLSVGPDCAASPPVAATSCGHEDAEAWIRSPSLWPARPAGLRDAWTVYYRALAEVAERLMQVMAVALHLPSDHFAPMIDRPITSMRALHYPALVDLGDLPGGAAAATSLRAGAHSDYGTLTILRTDDVAGLEIRHADGRWSPVDSDPDSFVVNLGDSIAQWTNDRWQSTVHRVTTRDAAPRQSFAFFHMANWDATIECLPTCREPGRPPRHEPVQAGPWLMRKFHATVG